MQHSPYTPGTVTSELFGREKFLESANMRLALLSTSPRLDGRITVFVGPRGVGKTSLLRVTEREAAHLGFLNLWVTAGEGSVVDSLLAQLLEVSSTWKSRSADRLRQLLESLQFSFAGLRVAAPQRSESEFADPALSRKLQEVLVQAAQVSFDQRKSGLAIFIDELQLADPESLRALAYAWQHMQSENPEIPAICFAAGLGNTQDVVTEAVSFAERFQYRLLGNLSSADAAKALENPAQACGVRWHQEALNSALEACGGYPYFLQLYGDECWKAASYPDPGAMILPSSAEQGASEFALALENFFRARWTKATPKEAEFLVAMAATGHDEVDRKDIAEALGVSTQAISTVRKQLIDKGIISAEHWGKLSFTAPGFGAYVREFHQS
ncbi:AAA family ATPase [Corynebacterium kozikiae]|uniref:AAA family ATPase n=1 Tax=Corynebacterium kozikiae TaxID=2968469 RepID=UPI00211BD42B|nr:AAA family ATPase [Corynebacterium sp. 76QC2CO]MCQ9344201.1 AAA family ATPase [Corynebacterium sp. 76QC2CO]